MSRFTSDVWLLLFLYLNLFDLYNISFVFKRLNFLVHKSKRYKQHIRYSKSIISNKKWSTIIDEQFLEFYSQINGVGNFDKHFSYLNISYFIPNAKHKISILNVLSHMHFRRRFCDQNHDCMKCSGSLFNDMLFNQFFDFHFTNADVNSSKFSRLSPKMQIPFS